MSNTAIVESIIQRPAPRFTVVSMPNGKGEKPTDYQFTPDKLGRHVCPVENADHLARFQRVPEGFRVVDFIQTEQPKAEQDEQNTQAAQMGAQAEQAIAVTETKDETAPVQAAQDQQQHDLEALLARAEGGDDAALEDLRSIFNNVVGRQASPRAKPITLVAQIEAVTGEKA